MLQLLHHLAGDHTTLEVMYAEVQAYLLGRQASLPPPLPFRNLVAQARLGLSREEHETFFRKMLGDVDEPAAPFGLLEVRGDGVESKRRSWNWMADLARRLRAQARRLGVSAASLCHLAWATGTEQGLGTRGCGLWHRPVRTHAGWAGRRPGDGAVYQYAAQSEFGLASGGGGQCAAVPYLLADLMRHEHASLALAQRCSAVPAPAPLFTALLNYRHSPAASQLCLGAGERASWEGM